MYTIYIFSSIQFIWMNAVPPKVIKNDEMSWEDLRKLIYEEDAFDNIVVSPGPGSPMCNKDIGKFS